MDYQEINAAAANAIRALARNRDDTRVVTLAGAVWTAHNGLERAHWRFMEAMAAIESGKLPYEMKAERAAIRNGQDV